MLASMMATQLRDSIEQKQKLGWSMDINPSFTGEDIVEIFGYRPYSGTFRLVTIADVRKTDAMLLSFEADEASPNRMCLKETHIVLQWVLNNPDKVYSNLIRIH